MVNLNAEKLQILDMIDERREFLLSTLEGLGEEQIRTRSTVSELTLGSIIKHLIEVEAGWVRFMREGADPEADARWESLDWEGVQAGAVAAPEWLLDANAQWVLEDSETIETLTAGYNETASHTRTVVADLNLDHEWELPRAPWQKPGEKWSNRQVLLHLLAETSQHSGHADIIRESIDGRKTMG